MLDLFLNNWYIFLIILIAYFILKIIGKSLVFIFKVTIALAIIGLVLRFYFGIDVNYFLDETVKYFFSVL